MAQMFKVKNIPNFNCLELSFKAKYSNKKNIIQKWKHQEVYEPGQSYFCHYTRFPNLHCSIIEIKY